MPTQVASLFVLMAGMSATGLAVFSVRLARLPSDSTERIVGELRLSQAGATLLAVTAALYAGLAVANEATTGATADVALAGAFAIIAMLAHLREPRAALMLLAAAFAAHALVDIAHRPGLLPVIAPRWLATGGAVCDLLFAALCFLPVWRR